VSIHDSKNLENTLKFRLAVECDFESAFSFFVTQVNLGAQPLSQLVLDMGYMGIGRAGGMGWRRGCPAGLQSRRQCLSLPHVQVFLQNSLGDADLLPIPGQTEDGFGMPHRQPAIPDITLD